MSKPRGESSEGYAPHYTVSTKYGRLQPVLVIGELVYCPAEGWARISSGIGFYPVQCAGNGLMHTSFPGPRTRRRMRRAWNNTEVP